MADKKKKDGTGFPGDLSTKQQQAYDAFSQFVYNTCGCKNPPYNDYAICRFLRARKFDLDKTKKMFSDYLQWRLDHEVQNSYLFKFEELDNILDIYQHGYHKTDKLGRPIYIESYSKMDLKKLWTFTNEDRIVQYFIQSYEYLLYDIFPECSNVKNAPITQTLTILDVKGAGLGLFSQIKKFFQVISKVASDNYPEILGQMFIINAPMLFSAIYALAKPFIDKGTRKKIKVLGSGYKKELLQYIDEENLPEQFGGKCKCAEFGGCLKGQNIGPWNPKGLKLHQMDFQKPFVIDDYNVINEHRKKLGLDLNTCLNQNGPIPIFLDPKKQIGNQQQIEEMKK